MSGAKRFSCYLVGEGALLTQCAAQILEAGHEILGVISPMAETRRWADARNLRSGDVAAWDELLVGEFDYLLSITNYWMAPQALLKRPRLAAINYHDGPLPKYAGLNAPSWAILNGETTHGVAWHRMAAQADAGPVLTAASVPVEQSDTARSLNLKCFEAALESFQRLLARLEARDLEGSPQSPSGRTYFGKDQRPPLLIEWGADNATLDRLRRAADFGGQANPFGTLWAGLPGGSLLVHALSEISAASTAAAATVLAVNGSCLDVATANGALRLELRHLDGTDLSSDELAARYGVRPGDILPTSNAAQLRDWAKAQGALAGAEAWWVQRLADLTPVEWPGAGRTEPMAEGAPCEILLSWPPAPIAALAQQTGEGPDDVLLAAVLAFLGRVGGEPVFDVGLVREADGVERDLVAAQAPLRAPALPPEASLLRHVKATAEERRRHCRRTGLLRDIGDRRPEVAAAARLVTGEGLPVLVRLGARDPASRPSGVELILNGSATSVTLRFDPARLPMAEATEVFRAFDVFFRSLLTTPDQPVSEAPLLSPDERQRLLETARSTDRAFPQDRTIHELFVQQAGLTPDAFAVRFGATAVTYAELDRRSLAIASRLQAEGVGPGDFVGVFLDRSDKLVAGLLGVLRTGAAYVPLDRSYPPQRLTYMLTDAAVSLVLTETALVGSLPGSTARHILLDAEGAEDEPAAATRDERSADGGQFAYLIYTSGSTGQPKGVLVPHRSLTNLLCAQAASPGFSKADTIFALATVCFDIFATEVFLPLICGGCIDMISSEDAADGFRLLELLETRRPTVVQATPATWRMLIAAGWSGSPALRMISTGEALPLALAEQLVGRGGSLWNFYGPTETTVFSSGSRVLPGRAITIGWPLANTQMYVLDARLEPTPLGVAGDLYIGGEGLTAGYLNKPELTERSFIHNPLDPARSLRLYRTGDRARRLAGGEIDYLGRSDNQVKLRGFRIELAEVEYALCRHPQIAEAAAVVATDASGDGRLLGFFRPIAPDLAPTAAEFRAFLATSLPGYMIPSRFIVLGHFPLTPSGKVDRRALAAASAHAAPEAGPDPAAVAPNADTADVVADAWRRHLKHNEFGRDDNFFDCGGDSVMLVAMLAELGRRFGRKLSAVDMLRFPTVTTFAQLLAQAQAQAHALATARTAGPATETWTNDRRSRLAGLRRRTAEARNASPAERHPATP